MELVLVSITGMSLVLAIVMGVVVFKVLRQERLRSDARVALLAAAAGDPPPLPRSGFELEYQALPVGSTTEQPLGSSDLFAAHDGSPLWPRRVGIAAGVAVLVAVATFGASRASQRWAAVPASQSLPLELTSLQHTISGNVIAITGTVLNPAAGAPVLRLAATASVFGPGGSLLAQGRAPLDYAMLAPGEESAFLINIRVPAGDAVVKYRVGFRLADGTAAAHVDRRTDSPSARSMGSTEGAPWVH